MHGVLITVDSYVNGEYAGSATPTFQSIRGRPFGGNPVMGSLDQWPPEWPRGGDGYDQKFGWKTQPPPEMEPFPKRIGLGPKGVEVRPEFDPTVSPSNASRFSRFARGSLNALGKLLGGAASVMGGTFVDMGGIMLGPAFLANPCSRGYAAPGCRRPDLEAASGRSPSRRRM